MKKTLVTFSVASMLLGSLAACGADQQRVQNVDEPRTFQMNQPSRGPFDLAGNRDRAYNYNTRDRANNFTTFDTNNNNADMNPHLNGERTYAGTFDDVPEDFWENVSGALVIEWAADVGLFEGVGDNKFAPNKELTTAEAAMLLSRLHKMGAIAITDEDDNNENDSDGTNNDTDGTNGNGTDTDGTNGNGANTDDQTGEENNIEDQPGQNTVGTQGLGMVQ